MHSVCWQLDGRPSHPIPAFRLSQVCILDGWGENVNKDEWNAIHVAEASLTFPRIVHSYIGSAHA